MSKILELLPKGNQFFTLVLDDETLIIHQETVITYHLFTLNTIDAATLKKLKKSDAINQAKTYALKKLSHKFYTPKRLKEALSMVNYTQEVIDKTIEDLTSLGYINEEKSFNLVVQDFLDFELKGKKALIDKLYKEGFKKFYIDQVNTLLPTALEREKVIQFIDASHKTINGTSYAKKKLSLKQKLYQRGFETSVIESGLTYFEQTYLDFDEDSVLQSIIEKNTRYNLQDFKDKQRFMQKLLRDGFNYEAIKKYLK